MTWVCCRTRRSRARNTRAAAWACSLLGATKRIVGRWAASQIASASVALFFCRLTNGLTYAGGISRTACPSMPISRVARPGLLKRLHVTAGEGGWHGFARARSGPGGLGGGGLGGGGGAGAGRGGG